MIVNPITLVLAGIAGLAVESVFGGTKSNKRDSRPLGTVVADICKKAVDDFHEGLEKNKQAAKATEASEVIEDLKAKVEADGAEAEARNSKSDGHTSVSSREAAAPVKETEQEIETTIIKK